MGVLIIGALPFRHVLGPLIFGNSHLDPSDSLSKFRAYMVPGARRCVAVDAARKAVEASCCGFGNPRSPEATLELGLAYNTNTNINIEIDRYMYKYNTYIHSSIHTCS